jgi:hypothetical protein
VNSRPNSSASARWPFGVHAEVSGLELGKLTLAPEDWARLMALSARKDGAARRSAQT